MHFKLLVGLCLALAVATPARTAPPDAVPTWRLPARIVAVGLPGVAGVRQVGRFHRGGPIPGNPEFLLSTSAERVLDPKRVLVAVAGNFGAPQRQSRMPSVRYCRSTSTARRRSSCPQILQPRAGKARRSAAQSGSTPHKAGPS